MFLGKHLGGISLNNNIKKTFQNYSYIPKILFPTILISFHSPFPSHSPLSLSLLFQKNKFLIFLTIRCLYLFMVYYIYIYIYIVINVIFSNLLLFKVFLYLYNIYSKTLLELLFQIS